MAGRCTTARGRPGHEGVMAEIVADQARLGWMILPCAVINLRCCCTGQTARAAGVRLARPRTGGRRRNAQRLKQPQRKV